MATPQSLKHQRSTSSRSSRPRASTKGPLDLPDDDPLSSDDPASPRSPQKSQARTSHLSSDVGPSDSFDLKSLNAEIDSILASESVTSTAKDLSFLLRPEIYHPLSQLEIPPVFRTPFYSPSIEEPIEVSMGILNGFLTQGHFLLAAHLCAILLTSPAIRPLDRQTIFTLFYTRLACLELTGNTAFAAQESKALEDLHSTFYYVDTDLEVAGDTKPQTRYRNSYHIVPWPLRVLAVRLQSIGFGDSRRGITGLYELGFEARAEAMRPGLDKAKKQIWQERLSDLGIRSVNALVEMGDLDAAQRSLGSLGLGDSDAIKVRAGLLALRIGDITTAKDILDKSSVLREGVLKPLTSMADGNYDEAISEWRTLLETSPKSAEPMIVQNLAVCLLYTGQLNEARSLLESLISANHSFQSLTFNLATIYELCSDKSRDLKVRLVQDVSKHPHTGDANVDRTTSDFKL
ncbi:hypothetical protein BGW36DRAFT_200347 [Talaromyces proteolyticus]|uniref:Trafficking protein particle complex subunit 12 n=1 Tax=Talaromyces proteolyticus TaxID=1131652 RepID=A0AAD4KL95_9EURO|nr:uncharacterized protein BGW36DRAFT_200347 [Talaromyces proteolyticus]KAH8695328.1 hypothetical protein BGW36DRAFT_200347 [Talaromyces proteolyticus]